MQCHNRLGKKEARGMKKSIERAMLVELERRLYTWHA